MARRSIDLIAAMALLVPFAVGCGGAGFSGAGDSRARPTGSGGSGSSTAGSAGTGGPTSVPGGTGTAGSGIGVTGAAGGAATGVGGATSPPSNTGDQYVPVGTNPFIMTAHDPLSTFAADVDTASYDIFRRDVNLGLLPQPASVRLEEHVNYFDYAYQVPTAADAHPFRISLAAAGDMFHRRDHVAAGGNRRARARALREAPANVVFLVDVSGSMAAADKLPLVKRVLARTLDVVSPEDTISIVTYSATAVVRLAPTPRATRRASCRSSTAWWPAAAPRARRP